MTELRFENLTKEQLDYLVDGCGKPGYLDVPDFVFSVACERHDFDYWVGCNETDRLDSDVLMYRTMIDAIAAEPWYRRYWLYPVASAYYWAVRLASSKFFYHGEEKRTLEDLAMEMDLV